MRKRATRRQLIRYFLRRPIGIAALLITAGVILWILFTALAPLPSRSLTIATGPPGNAYVQVADRYREILARDGVRLTLLPTNGAVDNLQRLRNKEASVGFVQAGTTNEQESPQLWSLGTIFYEPLWTFCRCTTIDQLLHDHAKPRISVGPQGSATRPLALKLLKLLGIDASQVEIRDYAAGESVSRLTAEEIDLAFILSSWEASAVQQLLHAPKIALIDFRRADAYVALQPNFTKLILPEGIVDLRMDRPPKDIQLIAAKASLVVRRDLHPALQYLLLRAAMEVHAPAGVFQRAGEFPTSEVIDLPISDQASVLYKAGPSFLQRTLPFWLAELVQRLVLILVPIAGILYPLWSVLPRVYRWQMQRRIYRFYGELRFLQDAVIHSKSPAQRARLITRIDNLERRVADLHLPRAFSEMTFNLRAHVHRLRRRAEEPA